jgi:23S rRNA (guanine745-N1)-methyltransferase
MLIWQCPVCSKPLVELDARLCCENNHSFDRAKQGYFNLLLSNQKRSAEPGDSKAMMQARREFLNTGLYRPLLQQLQQWLVNKTDSKTPVNLLDCGSGEGYYLAALVANTNVYGYGIDISKVACSMAARVQQITQLNCSSAINMHYAVASNFNLPIQSDSVDVVLRLFAPSDDAEVCRVLNEGGEFWRVSPGPDHLTQLKAQLYEQSMPHDMPTIPNGMRLLRRTMVRFDLKLSSAGQIQQLLGMTPFVWQAPKQKQEGLQKISSLDVTAEFVVESFVVNGPDITKPKTSGFTFG